MNMQSSAFAANRKPVHVTFDTETTGLFQFKDKATGLPVPADAPGQPRLASFAAIIADAEGQEIERHKFYVKPDGWSIDGTEAGRVNGLTDAFLNENGVPVSEVLDIWNTWIDAGLQVSAFNAQFDQKMMRAELRRAGRDDRFEETKAFCLMRALAPYGPEGLCISRGYVKLSEACAYFGIVNENAHDAMSDAEANLRILQILIRDGRVPEAKVHYSKAREGSV
ncbi:3'-5' exonuclease [Pseudogemmobacter sonorensis]|uniref:3'-5' exonuclease n=1 Tax=Pseudogemmobacter sonorensis TaxID=2989681 RepID=UPI00368E2808